MRVVIVAGDESRKQTELRRGEGRPRGGGEGLDTGNH